MAAKIRQITSKRTGKVYQVRKLRTQESHNLSVWHYRRAGDVGPGSWQPVRSRHGDTLAAVRKELGG
jgi:hypothetical protein